MGIRYVCKKCGRQFKSPYYLAVHKKCSTNSNTGSDSVDNRSADSAINIVTTPAMIGLGSTDVGELMANSVEADQDQ